MYLPRHFEASDRDSLRDLIAKFPLVHIVQHVGDTLQANPVPMLLVEEAGGQWFLQGHVARANPMWQAAGADVPVLAIIAGPDQYISPSWYPTKAEHGRVVPTWNYACWHARGPLRAVEDPTWLLDLLHRLTNRHESRQPKPWAVDDAPPDYVDGLLKAIVGIEIRVDHIEAKFKLSQNHPLANRQGVIAGLAGSAVNSGGETDHGALRQLMSDRNSI